MLHWRPWSLIALIALAACGDPIVDDGFRGEPLATFTGEVVYRYDRLLERPANLRAAVFWSALGVDGGATDELVEDPATSQPIDAVPGAYTLHLFDAPAAMAPGGAYAIGHVLLYADLDGDGARGADEPFAGGLAVHAILYAPAALTRHASPTRLPLAAGFHRVAVPMPCAAPPTNSDPDDCGVDLGAACGPAIPCAAGVCVDDEVAPSWPGGACAVPAAGVDGCVPATGALIPGRGPADAGYWVAGCSTDADCADGRQQTCDQGARACLPSRLMSLMLDLGADPPRGFCRVEAPSP